MSRVLEDLKEKTPKSARELDRNQELVRMLSLMTASHLLRAEAREIKRKLLLQAGWTMKVVDKYPWRKDPGKREMWTSPDGLVETIFDFAWNRHFGSLRKKALDPCTGCIAEALGLSGLHTCGLSPSK